MTQPCLPSGSQPSWAQAATSSSPGFTPPCSSSVRLLSGDDNDDNDMGIETTAVNENDDMATDATGANEHRTALAVQSIESETCAEGSAPLHRLCDNCQKFFDNWEVLDWIESGLQSENVSMLNAKLCHFCTVAQLLDSQGRCHCCMLLLAYLINEGYSDYTKHQGHVFFRLLIPVVWQELFVEVGLPQSPITA